MRKKVAIIGAGHVGASAAQLLAYDGVADVVLFDIAGGMPQGKALDIAEACPLYRSSVSVAGTNEYRDTANSDVVVVTAGFPRKPGMSRDDLLVSNAKVVAGVMEETVKHSPDAVFIIVTNPMDVMAQLALQVSALDHWKIVGMGGVLDSARFRAFVAMELGVSAADVEALVMGGHGDTMVPMPRFTTVKGVPITELLAKGKIDGLVARTRQGGAEIVSLLKTGSAFYAPAAAISHMVKAVVRDEKRVLPCSAFLEGEYGVHEVFAGVPVILGAHGVERIIELELDEDERRDFEKSVSSVRTHFGMIA
jgi:malate dehydrogenase